MIARWPERKRTLAVLLPALLLLGVVGQRVLGFGNPDGDLHRELQKARLAAELSCGRPTVLAWEPPDPASLETLDWSALLVATTTGSPAERWRAISLLGELRDPRALPALLAALSDRRGTVRPCLAAQSLGALRDPRAVDALIAAVGARDNEDLRLCAIKALGLLRTPRAVPALVDAVERRDMTVAAAYALARIGDPRGARAVAGAARVEALTPWLVEPLGEFGVAETEPALRAIAGTPAQDVATRAAAEAGLWKLSLLVRADRADALLRVLSESRLAARRAWAAWRLGDEHIVAAADALGDALGDADTGVRSAAATALLRLEGASEASLLDHLDAGGAEGRLAVAALGFVGGARSLPALRAVATGEGERSALARTSLHWLHLRGVRAAALPLRPDGAAGDSPGAVFELGRPAPVIRAAISYRGTPPPIR